MLFMLKSILVGMLILFWQAPASAGKDQIGRFTGAMQLVAHGGQRKVIHQDHVALPQAEAEPNGKVREGFLLIVIGAVLIAYYFVPVLPKLAALLILTSSAIVLLDIAFRLGLVYSVLLVTIGLFLLQSFLQRKKKQQPTQSDKVSSTTRKAA
jgi:hypothetical protein